MSFVAFDVLWLDGELLVDRPQRERRRVLDSLGLHGRAWQTAPVVDATPEELLDACRLLGLEGFMAKRLDAPYQPGRRWSGLSGELLGQLNRLFAQIGIPTSPFTNPPRAELSYARPILVTEVAYTEVTETGTLRQPSIKGLRTDVIAGEVTWDDEIAACFTDPR